MPTRVVRGELNESRSLSGVSLLAELAFVKLILACDDFGRLDARSSVLKARLFPARDSVTPGKLVAAIMELGCDGVLLDTAVAHAKDPVLMAEAMRLACDAGRKAFLAGRIPRKYYAEASSPKVGKIGGDRGGVRQNAG